MKKIFDKIISCVIVVLMVLLLAVNYHIFIVENHFAPARLNGIATMIQYKTGLVYDNTFSFYQVVNETYGNFKFIKHQNLIFYYTSFSVAQFKI